MTPKGVYKRGRTWWVRYVGPDGKMRFESSGSRFARDAAALLDRRRGEVRAGTAPPRRIADHTFAELADRYTAWCAFQKAADRKFDFIRALRVRFGNFRLRAISPYAIEEYRNAQLAAGRKAATANRHLATLRHMFTKAVEWEMVEEQALKRIRGVRMLREENERLRFLSLEESHRLIGACEGVLREVVICALTTGMRREELLGLTWPQVDLVHGLIRLEKTKGGDPRTLPIASSVREVLERRAAERTEGVPYVFVDKNGRRYRDLKRSFRTAMKKAVISNFRFHDLRHTFASHLVMAGVDLATVRELLGHHDIKMTLRYAHLSPGHRRQAVDRLALVPPPSDTAAAGAVPDATADPGALPCLPSRSAVCPENEVLPEIDRDGAAATAS